MEIRGFVIGADMYGRLRQLAVSRTVEKMPSIEEIEVKGISELKLVSLNGYQKKRIVDSLEWVGDIDSCEADRIISLSN